MERLRARREQSTLSDCLDHFARAVLAAHEASLAGRRNQGGPQLKLEEIKQAATPYMPHILQRFSPVHFGETVYRSKVAFEHAVGVRANHALRRGRTVDGLVGRAGGAEGAGNGPDGTRAAAVLGPLRFVNHSCWPNCALQKTGDLISLKAIRDIAPGEEVTVNFGKAVDKSLPSIERHANICPCLVCLWQCSLEDRVDLFPISDVMMTVCDGCGQLSKSTTRRRRRCGGCRLRRLLSDGAVPSWMTQTVEPVTNDAWRLAARLLVGDGDGGGGGGGRGRGVRQGSKRARGAFQHNTDDDDEDDHAGDNDGGDDDDDAPPATTDFFGLLQQESPRFQRIQDLMERASTYLKVLRSLTTLIYCCILPRYINLPSFERMLDYQEWGLDPLTVEKFAASAATLQILFSLPEYPSGCILPRLPVCASAQFPQSGGSRIISTSSHEMRHFVIKLLESLHRIYTLAFRFQQHGGLGTKLPALAVGPTFVTDFCAALKKSGALASRAKKHLPQCYTSLLMTLALRLCGRDGSDETPSHPVEHRILPTWNPMPRAYVHVSKTAGVWSGSLDDDDDEDDAVRGNFERKRNEKKTVKRLSRF
ncbi:hypothetical protein DFJ73DRAFT_815890 [Zopfochytrium polystomum]|nr:hypothetical protein DFJ73DRAFT_815890 [Zopfochytrium polystomum]